MLLIEDDDETAEEVAGYFRAHGHTVLSSHSDFRNVAPSRLHGGVQRAGPDQS